jgi:hypothetical protein
MAITINGTTGIAGVDGSAGTPAVQGADTNTGIFFPAADTIAFGEGGAEVMRIDSSGNLAIGATSASFGAGSGVELVRSGTATFRATSGGQGVEYRNNAGTAEIDTRGAFPIVLLTNQSERARIDSSGNLLVGGTFGSGVQVFYNNTDGVNSRSGQGAGNGRSLFTGWYSATSTTQGTLSFNVTTNGNVTNTNNSYGAISDIKLKENITDATPKLEKLCQVRVVNYNFKEGQTQKQLGVIAQELEQVFPAMVEESQDRDEEGNNLGTTTKSIKYSVFVPMLIKAIQELKAELDTVKAQNAAFEARLAALEAK